MSASTSEPARRHFLHPLESVPMLGRMKPGIARDILFTVVGVTLTALLFSFITKLNVPSTSISALLYVNGVFSACIGFSIHLFSAISNWVVMRRNGAADAKQLLRADVAAWLAGGVFGYLLGAEIIGVQVRFWSGVMIVLFWVCWMIVGILTTQRQQAKRDLELARERTARSDAERLLTVSHLKMLQAQIEPHFLFNTLANVSSLIDADPKRARVMLDQFTLLLRALLDQTRQSATTLRKELQVAEAYLSVLKIRMGERLSYQIDTPSDLIDTEVPAMLLQPIVENAVKHGIEPKMQGGMVRVSAAREGNDMVLAVEDNGVGFVAHSKESIGLGAIRERLAVQFGDAARLEISRTQEQWTRVAIRIPMSGKSMSSIS